MTDMQEKPFIRGVISTLAGGTLWGASGACAQFLLSHYAISSLFITMIRMLGASILFVAYLHATNPGLITRIVSERSWRNQLIVFGCVGLYLDQLTYVITIGFTNAGTATVLASVGIVIIMLATCVIQKRLPRAGEIIALVCATVATVCIATKGDFSTISLPIAGLFWGLANAVLLAFYNMQPHKLFNRWGSMPVTGLGMAYGGISGLFVWLGVIVLVSFKPLATKISDLGISLNQGDLSIQALLPTLDLAGWLMVLFIITVGTFAAFGLYLHGISLVGSMKGSLLGAIEPVSATVLSAVWLGSVFVFADWTGLFLMLITITLVSSNKHQDKHLT